MTDQLLAYHGSQEVKDKYVSFFAHHRKLDQVVQGTGFDRETGRGCFIGCTLQRYDHQQFSVELGFPVWLAYLADRIFEGLPLSEAPQFGTDLLNAVKPGQDLNAIKEKLSIKRIEKLGEFAGASALLNEVLTQIQKVHLMGATLILEDRRALCSLVMGEGIQSQGILHSALRTLSYSDTAQSESFTLFSDLYEWVGDAARIERDTLLQLIRENQ